MGNNHNPHLHTTQSRSFFLYTSEAYSPKTSQMSEGLEKALTCTTKITVMDWLWWTLRTFIFFMWFGLLSHDEIENRLKFLVNPLQLQQPFIERRYSSKQIQVGEVLSRRNMGHWLVQNENRNPASSALTKWNSRENYLWSWSNMADVKASFWSLDSIVFEKRS